MSTSLVRDLYGSATSLSLPNPKLAPHGNSPECFVVVKPPVRSRWVVGVALTRNVPILRLSRRSNCGEIGRYSVEVRRALCVVVQQKHAVAALDERGALCRRCRTAGSRSKSPSILRKPIRS